MLIFNKALAKTSENRINMAAQYADLQRMRQDPRHALPASMFTNASLSPGLLYQEFDNQIIEIYREPGEFAIIDALLPGARSLPFGRSVLADVNSSDMGGFQTSMTGEVPVIYDRPEYDHNKAIVPVHQNGFKTNWREKDMLSLEGFSDAANKQAGAARAHREGLQNYILNGTDTTFDGVGWEGLRNDARVDQVDLGAGGVNFDFTSSSTSGSDYVEAFRTLAQRRALTQRVAAPATYFVSNEAYWSMDRPYTANYPGKIIAELRTIPTVGDIVPTSALSGNEILSMPVSPMHVQLLVGMGISTIAIPRPAYNSPFAFDVVSAVGVQIKRDQEGHTPVQFASE